VYIARVIGTVVSTCKEPNLTGIKLLVVQDLHDEGTENSVIAADTVGAGVGETVLILQEGGSAREALGMPEAPINDVIVGIIDHSKGYGPGLWS
jgi:ethanolamine utilization protein EutN